MIMLVCLFIVFLFGLIIGSFLNVCIYRLPQSKSIVFPGSMCPQCGAKIPFYDNIPVLSYLLLGGKCRFCKSVISPRYPLVEFITGLMASCLFLKFGATVEFPIYFIFTASLLVVTFIDIDHKIIPDIISLPGIFIFFAASFFHSYISYIESLLGILFGRWMSLRHCLALCRDQEKRGNGRRRYKAFGHDRCRRGLERGGVHPFCIIDHWRDYRYCHYGFYGKEYETDHSFWPVSFHWGNDLYLFRAGTHSLLC